MHARSKSKLATGVVIGICVLLWATPLAGQAREDWPITETQGILATVDLAGMTATLSTPAGPQVYTLASMTAVRVGGETETLGALPSFIGAGAVVLSTTVGGAAIAGRVDILVFPAAGTVATDTGGATGQEGRSGGSSGSSGARVGPCSECGSAAGTGPGGAGGGGGNSSGSGGVNEGGGRP